MVLTERLLTMHGGRLLIFFSPQ